MDWKLENPTIETALKYSQQDVELLTFDWEPYIKHSPKTFNQMTMQYVELQAWQGKTDHCHIPTSSK
jgi:hypothetical protein